MREERTEGARLPRVTGQNRATFLSELRRIYLPRTPLNKLFSATGLGRESLGDLYLYLDQLLRLFEFYEQLRLSPTHPQHALARVVV